ncbi:MAG: mcpB [Bacillota bacterium]|jgi:methyl-accepting chemotaxis protein|nr:mcpB [Bacillota bacterium]
MKINTFKTLSFKLSLIIILFALIPVLVISLITLSRMQSSIVLEQKKSVEKQLSFVSSNVDVVFSDMQNNVSYLARNKDIKLADNTISSYTGNSGVKAMAPSKSGGIEQEIFENFKEFGETHPNYRYVSMGTEHGGYIQYPEGNMDGAYDPRKRPWYPDAAANPNEAVLGSPYYFATDNIVLISASQAIKDTSGKVIGVMLVDMSLDSLTSMFEEASTDSYGYYMLVHSDGTIISDPHNKENNFKNISEVYDSDFAKAVSSNADFERMKIEGKDYLVKSISSESTGWNYVSVVDEYAMNKVVRDTRNFVYLLMALIFAGAAAFALVVSNGISKPIKAVVKSANEVANGDFNVKIDVKATGEIGLLIDSFKLIGKTLLTYKSYIEEISGILNQIADGNINFKLESDYMGEFSKIKDALLNISKTLTQTLTEIKVASDQIASGSDQVAAGAQALSQGATEQASSIQELSATIQDISTQIDYNAKTVQNANTLSNQAGAGVMEANGDMLQLMNAMQEINDKSNEISNIIKTIDNIAFQTNILALNAAVEAARAGSAGKGFAVVADEVRNLAQKSAEAAKDTTLLISDTVQAVNKGTRIAEKTALSLNAVVEKTEGLTHLIESIAQASIHQAEGSNQIAIGIEQVSAVVQTNSATAEESAAASEELSSQATLLNDLVNKFKLSDDETQEI